ncbi:hypothetical protein [Streptomyces albus]|uniref:hypothetical protein n=1 Tax=Streptomyces albus TaxID=1888 RepID=UPI00131C94CC|nr:hypothetical protein [Streptomyces albus]
MDFLASAVRQLADEEEESSLKYGVLHLQAAAEVLLKVRLIEEHWTLVFKNPGLASRESYERGDFESCTLEGAMERLGKISGIEISEKAKSRIKRLSRYRNQLQHYGAQLDSTNAVKAVAIDVLDFLVDFVVGWVGPTPESDTFDDYHDFVDVIRKDLHRVEELTEKRLKRVTKDLREDSVVTDCPSCGKRTLVFEDLRSAKCRFCHRSEYNAAFDALTVALHPEKIEEAENRCQTCDSVTFILDIFDERYVELDNDDDMEVELKLRREFCLECKTVIESRHKAVSTVTPTMGES